MIVYGALILVVIVTLVFYFLFKKRILWWEFFIPIIVVTLLIFGVKALINQSNVQFTEYWGETIISVTEEEPYNYWHSETCSRQYACGTDEDGNTEYCTEYYDCSHQDDVGPSWECKTNLDNSYRISEKQHDQMVTLFGTGKKISSYRSNYDADDLAVWSKGTKFEGRKVGTTSYVYTTLWGKTDETRKGIFTEHRYENRIKASDLSLFNISVVTDEIADSLGLFKYPKVKDYIDYPTILGKNISDTTQELFKKLNAKFGSSNKLRLWVIVFDDKPASIASMQENYWVKGNKNELVVCIGRHGEEIQWVHSFSWSLSGDLTAEVAQKVLNLYQYTIVTSRNNKDINIAIPLTKRYRQKLIYYTGIDTTIFPDVLLLPISNKITYGDKIVKFEKSSTPILTEETWEAYYNYLNENLCRFQKRSFEEFSYLTIEPKPWQIIIIYIIALIVSIVINIWTCQNEFKEKI